MTAGALVVRDLAAGYRNRKVVRGVTLPEIAAGEVVALVGPNAAGKSTLLRAMAGLLPCTGTLRLGDVDLGPLPLRARAAHITFMPQTLPQGIGLNVLEAVISALRASPLEEGPTDAAAIRHRAAAALDRIGIGALALESLDHLSGGQRQLVGLAQAIVREPRLFLLDEPTSALDLRHQIEVMATIRDLAHAGRTVVVVLHDLSLAARWADRVVVMADGTVAASGTPEEALTTATLSTVYGVIGQVERNGAGALSIHAERPV